MSMRRDWKTTVLFVPALLLVGASAMAQAPQAANPVTSLTPVTDAMLRDLDSCRRICETLRRRLKPTAAVG